MSAKKIFHPRPVMPAAFSLLADRPPLLQRIYYSRGVTCATQTGLELAALLPFTALRHIDAAARLLATCVQQQQRILIVGDFDADGATSTALAMSALQQLGATQVDYFIPNRFDFGYGLTPEIIQHVLPRKPALIITVDNGIASHAGVQAAKAQGIAVLITDHHLPGATLPAADVIVNPNQPGDEFPSKNLAGVGVIFYVMLALRQQLRAEGWFGAQRPEPAFANLLDLVALGTVADVVPLDHNNRILVQQGLKRIRAGRARPGIQALLQVAQRNAAVLTASDLGFAIAPRLNAAGRLEDMAVGVACLLREDKWQALRYAGELDSLNKQRQEIEADMLAQAQTLMSQIRLENLPAGICLYQADWHQGVIGILAGRLKAAYHRPTIIFAQTADNQLKGSARSIPHLHMRDVLATIDARFPGLIEKFGGHAMAAGVTLPAENFAKFQQIYCQTVASQLTAEQLQNILLTDGELAVDELTLESALLLRDDSPWGQDFPEPVFEGNFRILQQTCIADKHLRLLVKPDNSDITLEALYFNCTALPVTEVYMAYRLQVDYFRKTPQLKLVVEAVRE